MGMGIGKRLCGVLLPTFHTLRDSTADERVLAHSAIQICCAITKAAGSDSWKADDTQQEKISNHLPPQWRRVAGGAHGVSTAKANPNARSRVFRPNYLVCIAINVCAFRNPPGNCRVVLAARSFGENNITTMLANSTPIHRQPINCGDFSGQKERANQKKRAKGK